jgi:hypothetical protein
VSGTQQVNYGALDNVGVRVARAVAGGSGREHQARPCNFALRIPCPNGSGSIRMDTRQLVDGVQPLQVRAEDAAGNWSDSSPVTVRVDNTAPGAIPLTMQGGEGWRNSNHFDVSWLNAEAPSQAPIAAAHYRLCGPADGNCLVTRLASPNVSRAGVSVPSPGEWNLRLWREDSAGNHLPANASVPVVLRYDPEPPAVAFEQPSRSDPTLMAAAATDHVSGIAGGQIEISAFGSGIWHQIDTVRTGGRLLARVDDARFPAGTYVLRATAYDRAWNQSTSDQRLDGSQMTITLPLRAPTTMRAGVLLRPQRHRDRRRSAPRRLARTSRASLDSELKLAGQVKLRNGPPVPGAEVHILASSEAATERLVATLRADQHGRYVFVTRARSTMAFRMLYPGTPTELPSQARTRILVPAASSIRARPRRVVNGRQVTFSGDVRSTPTPPDGKLIELQVVLSGRWQTFKTVQSGPDGRWATRYRFRRSCGLLRYRFRARLPEESGYPFEAGQTRRIGVQVRGAPCR